MGYQRSFYETTSLGHDEVGYSTGANSRALAVGCSSRALFYGSMDGSFEIILQPSSIITHRIHGAGIYANINGVY